MEKEKLENIIKTNFKYNAKNDTLIPLNKETSHILDIATIDLFGNFYIKIDGIRIYLVVAKWFLRYDHLLDDFVVITYEDGNSENISISNIIVREYKK